ncbi:MAG TPA: serine/threonine-protein kinase, partial [Thermoanaerobaculia bacterium]
MIGPYRILEELGAGGMGEVFLVHDERLDRRVAIKRIRPEAGGRSEARERFRREARLAARLSHPAIVQVYDILQENDSDSIVMEYVEGRNLRQMIEHGPLAVHRALELAREIADGLDAAHRQGIVHRDLKTENVLVTPEGRPKIADFGIAKRLAADGGDTADAESLTRDHGVVGTWRAMAPEQARGEEVDARTDLFAFGVLLYEMLTGRSPFTAENGLATLHRVMHARQTPAREINPAVPEAVSRLVDQLLEKEPPLRPQSAGQVRRELDRLALATADFEGTGTLGETVVERVPFIG